jgi:hypothetical protein
LVVSRKRLAENVARIKDKKKHIKTVPRIAEANIQLGGLMRRRNDGVNMDRKEMRHGFKTC